jgi:hypothetical protein
MTAGPSFELFYETDYLMPHREAAWALLAERLDEAAWLCAQLAAGRGKRIASQLQPVLAAMREIAQSLAAHLPASPARVAAGGRWREAGMGRMVVLLVMAIGRDAGPPGSRDR